MIKIKRLLALLMLLGVLFLMGCSESNADTVSRNLSTAAEQFEVQRNILVVNGITDKVLFQVEGRCSIEKEVLGLIVVCKHGPNDFRKHFIGISDNVTYVVAQPNGFDADEYRTRIILKPESVVPDFDLVTG